VCFSPNKNDHGKEGKMGEEHVVHMGEKRNECRILLGKPEGKILLER
jgi:hypothetical protein